MKPVTRAYRIWMGMRSRCNNPNNHAYHNYGGRGIAVCPEWESFKQFLEDMGDPPPGCSLDRRDNSLGYSKANCRWATWREQGQNKRTNRLLTFKGETLCLNEWARRTGTKRLTLRWRVEQGWSPERILTTPLEDPMDRKQSHMIYFKGEDRKSTRLNSSHIQKSRMPSSA